MGFSAEAMLLTKGAANAAPADAKGAFEKALSGAGFGRRLRQGR